MIPALDVAACSVTTWQVTPDLGLRAVLMAGLLLAAGWAGAQRAFPGQRAFVGMHAVMLGWVLATTLEHAAVDAPCKATLALLCWPVLLAQPVLWAAFLWRYVHSETGPWVRGLRPAVVAAWALLAALALSNGHHALFYGEGTGLGPPVLGLPRMQYDYGPGFVLAAAWGYAWLLGAIALVLHAWRQADGGQRRQWALFLVITVVPAAVNVAYVVFGVRLFGGDPTPLTFALALAAFTWLIRTDELFRTVPLARRLLFTALADPVLVLDRQDRVMDANDAARELAGGAPARAVPLAHWPLVGSPLAAALSRGDGDADGIAPLALGDPPRLYELRQRTIGEPGHPLGRLVQLRDVTERQRAQDGLERTLAERDAQLRHVAALQAELREQALRDPLTGLHNRRALVDDFAACLDAAAPLALAVLDVDHFKRINDRAGHAAGDRVLRALAHHLQGGLPARGRAYRTGGEEFVLLLPGLAQDAARQAVDALRAALADTALDGAPWPVGFSAGVAAAGRHGDTLDALLAAADAALYAAKDGGRGRVVAAG